MLIREWIRVSAVVAGLAFSTQAAAQDTADAPLPPVQAPEGQTVPASEPAPEAEPQFDEPPEEDSDPMAGIGLGVKVGLGMLARQKLTAARAGLSGTGTTRERTTNDLGLALAGSLYLGDGNGFASTIEVFHWRQKEESPLGDVNLYYTGGQAAFGAQFQLANPLYMFIGVGPRIGVVHGDVDRGVHLAARLPVALTFYPVSMLGIVAELGIGYGATGRASITGTDASTELVSSILLDFTVGLRFP